MFLLGYLLGRDSVEVEERLRTLSDERRQQNLEKDNQSYEYLLRATQGLSSKESFSVSVQEGSFTYNALKMLVSEGRFSTSTYLAYRKDKGGYRSEGYGPEGEGVFDRYTFKSLVHLICSLLSMPLTVYFTHMVMSLLVSSEPSTSFVESYIRVITGVLIWILSFMVGFIVSYFTPKLFLGDYNSFLYFKKL